MEHVHILILAQCLPQGRCAFDNAGGTGRGGYDSWSCSC